MSNVSTQTPPASNDMNGARIPHLKVGELQHWASEIVDEVAWTMALESQPLTDEAKAKVRQR